TMTAATHPSLMARFPGGASSHPRSSGSKAGRLTARGPGAPGRVKFDGPGGKVSRIPCTISREARYMSRAGVGALERAAPATLDIENVYGDYGDAVTRWAARLSGPGIETEDLVQEIFLIAHRKLGSFRHDAALATWLYRITERVVARRRSRERM